MTLREVGDRITEVLNLPDGTGKGLALTGKGYMLLYRIRADLTAYCRTAGATKRDASTDPTPLVSRLLDSAQITSLPTWAMALFLEAGEALIDAHKLTTAGQGGEV